MFMSASPYMEGSQYAAQSSLSQSKNNLDIKLFKNICLEITILKCIFIVLNLYFLQVLELTQ